MERISVLFVAAKWDAVESEYRSIEHYFRRNFTQTRAVLQSGRCQTTHIPFSVGRIEDVEVEDEHQGERYYVKRITSLENKYVDILIQWIYFTFTGNYLKGLPKLHKSLFDRAKDLFR